MTHHPEPDREAVLDAASEIVQAFAATDGDRYFAAFAPDASFVFHSEPERLADRAAYEQLWAGWLEGGWRVVSCTSSDPLVQTFPGGAVFSHSVATTVETGEGTDSYRERETIVFRVEEQSADFRVDEAGTATDAAAPRLIAVHEHLSPMPDVAAAPDGAASDH
ncbi:MAG TPA: nuclear transport factor 2 family protein [Agromyces sp.]